MMGRIDAIIDGGEVGIGLESTIIDLTVTPPQILRPGYITQEKLSIVLGTVDTDTTILRADSGQAPKAPGMKYRHYAPRGELTIVEGTPGQVRECILTGLRQQTIPQERRPESSEPKKCCPVI